MRFDDSERFRPLLLGEFEISRTKWNIPRVIPPIAPRMTKTTRVPNQVSIQYPKAIGTTISIEMVVMAADQLAAFAIEERSSTGGSSTAPLTFAVPQVGSEEGDRKLPSRLMQVVWLEGLTILHPTGECPDQSGSTPQFQTACRIRNWCNGGTLTGVIRGVNGLAGEIRVFFHNVWKALLSCCLRAFCGVVSSVKIVISSHATRRWLAALAFRSRATISARLPGESQNHRSPDSRYNR